MKKDTKAVIGLTAILLIIIEAITQVIFSKIADKITTNNMSDTGLFILKFICEWTPVFIFLYIVYRVQKAELEKIQLLIEVKMRLTQHLVKIRTQNMVNGTANSQTLPTEEATINQNKEMEMIKFFITHHYPDKFNDTEQQQIFISLYRD